MHEGNDGAAPHARMDGPHRSSMSVCIFSPVSDVCGPDGPEAFPSGGQGELCDADGRVVEVVCVHAGGICGRY